jgi:RNA-directed DNA polymerase
VANQILNALKVEKQPYQTFIGRASKGFDFLGYHLKPGGLTVAAGTIARNIERIDQLYEQGATSYHIRQYIQRWQTWVASHLGRVISTGLCVQLACLQP